MINNQNILEIDKKIKENFNIEKKKLNCFKNDLKNINSQLEIHNISKRTKQNLEKSRDLLKNKIDDIENEKSKYFYISETIEYIEKYKKILKTPIKMNFMGKIIKDNNSEKLDIIYKYLSIASKYTPDINFSCKVENFKCNNCSNTKFFDIYDNSIYICTICGSQQELLINTSSYNDSDRANISTKYTYDRKVHFRDCINQYQGKQNCNIEEKVYKDLEDQFRNHHLLIEGDNISKEEKFKNICKDHIHIFLNDLGYTKHYENVNLIHYNMTGKKPDDISHLEYKLLEDFDELTDIYDRKFKVEQKISRKNFINTQYVLYQLLNKHKHPCKKEDFNILKTVDRKAFHDDICRTLFAEKGWNFFPFF